MNEDVPPSGAPAPSEQGARAQTETTTPSCFQSSCVVEDLTGRTELPLGQSIEVQIRILFEDCADPTFTRAESVELYEGNRLVATGEFHAPRY